ncbi:ABC transporter substrate-binding protein [Microbacterium tumbae]
MRTRLMRRARWAAVAAASSALVLAGCAGGQGDQGGQDGGELRVGIVGLDFSNIDPGQGFARQVDAFMLEYLMKLSPTGEVEPNLAESVELRDDVTYVYTLRDDVVFSNGEELTADDVVGSINYARDPEFSESFRYADIADVVAEGDKTVVVTLNAPTASFQYVLAMNGYIFDVSEQESAGEDFGKAGEGLVGTGPYVLDELNTSNGKATYSANEDYWGGDLEFDSVTLTGFADENSEALAFRTGALDVAFPADPRAFASTSGTEVTTVPGTRQGLFVMNTQVEPWNDVHVRRAVAYAINKADIVNVIGGNAEPDGTIIPPSQLLSIASQDEVDSLLDSLETYDFDLDAAKAEMAKSSVPDGFEAELQTPSYGGYVEAAQAIAGQLSELGITLNVRVLSEAEYTNTFSQPHTQVPVQYTFFNNRTPDPGGMPKNALWSSAAEIGQNNLADYINPEMDALIEQGDATTDPGERFAAYSELLGIVADDVPYVPLYAGNINVALASTVEWPTFNAFSTDVAPYVLEIRRK